MNNSRITWKCPTCWDTGLFPVSHGIANCNCPAAGLPFNEAVRILRLRVNRLNLSAHPWDHRLVDCARLICHGTAEFPVSGDYLQAQLQLDRRAISDLVSVLRKSWQLPVVASRKQGYWVAATLEEFEANERPYRSQAFTMPSTSWAVRKANYPDFSGQTFFDFLNETGGNPQCQ